MAEITAAAAIFLRQRSAQQPFLAGLPPGVAIDAAGFVPFGLARQALALDEAAHRGAEHFVVFAIDAAHNHFHCSRFRIGCKMKCHSEGAARGICFLFD